MKEWSRTYEIPAPQGYEDVKRLAEILADKGYKTKVDSHCCILSRTEQIVGEIELVPRLGRTPGLLLVTAETLFKEGRDLAAFLSGLEKL